MRRKAQEWIYNLSDEDITFIKNFVMSSGSLKEVAKLYHITYPTVRLRLDRLIQKMQMNDQIENDAYISLIKKIDSDLSFVWSNAISCFRKDSYEYMKNSESIEFNIDFIKEFYIENSCDFILKF